MSSILPILCALVWIVAIVFVYWGAELAHAQFSHRAGRRRSTTEQEPISILKPVKGLEPGLSENLESFFHLRYRRFELLFSIADENDAARPVIEELIRLNPQVPARLLVGEERAGPNPKVNNLTRSYREALHDWILVSDSNVRVPLYYLEEVSRDFTKEVGVVTAIVRGSEPSTFGGSLEAAYLNTFYARWMLLAPKFGQDCVVGKSMLFRRSTADRFGGLSQLGRFLAEDYMAGQAMKQLGLKVKIMGTPISQPLPKYTLGDFWRRHVRWGRIRKAQAPLPVLIEPLLSLLGSGLLGAYAVHALFGISAGLVFMLHTLLWLLLDIEVLLSMGQEPGPKFIFAWAARELLAIPLWFHTICGSTVSWRGAKLKVKAGGILEVPAGY